MHADVSDFLSECTVPASPAEARVVLVEDDPYVGAAVTLYLRKKGFAVEHFTLAKKARAWLVVHPCDLVITDIFMPDSDGLELIEWLRQKHPSLRVIAISGSDGQGNSYLRVARLMGAARVLPKPFELPQLVDLINEVLLRRT